MRPKRFILPIVIIAALARDGAGQQANTGGLAGAASAQNAIVIADIATNRLFRVTDLSDTGVQIGPTVSGLSIKSPWHIGLDASGRIYVADRDNVRIVRMDDVAGNGWKAFGGAGANNFGLDVGGPGSGNAFVVSVNADQT